MFGVVIDISGLYVLKSRPKSVVVIDPFLGEGQGLIRGRSSAQLSKNRGKTSD